MTRYRIGPVTAQLSVEESSPELLRWAREFHAGRETTSPPDITIHLARAPERFVGPHPPTTTRMGANGFELAYTGWRAHLNINGPAAHCAARLSYDTDSTRGPRRIAAIMRAAVGRHLLVHGGLSLHAAAMIQGGQGWLFVGERGAGKTTIVRHHPGDRVLGDDHALLVPASTGAGYGYAVHGTPYAGREGTPCQAGQAPLAGICLLEQHPETHVEPVSAARAFSALLPTVIHSPADRADTEAVMRTLAQLIERRPVLRLRVNLTDSPWPLLQTTPPQPHTQPKHAQSKPTQSKHTEAYA